MLVTSVGIFGHRGWGRMLGLLLSFLGIVAGVAGVVAANATPSVTTTLNDGRPVTADTMSGAIAFLVFYAIIFLGLLLGGKHFRLKQVAPKE